MQKGGNMKIKRLVKKLISVSKQCTVSRIVSIALVLMLIVSMIPIATVSVSAAGQTSIYLEKGELYSYYPGWGWQTHELIADGQMVYCINPDKPLPNDGYYRTDKGNLVEIKSTDSKYAMYIKAMYYCNGGAGFNTANNAFETDTAKHTVTVSGNTPKAFMTNLKKTQWGAETITPTGDELYYLLTHHVLSYINLGHSKYMSTINGVIIPSSWGSAVVELYNAISKAPMPTTTQKLYKLDIGSKYQNILILRQGIKLQLQKASANSNLSYGLGGAVYNIYLDKACTDYFGSITTDDNGFGTYSSNADVPVQTYYCKEIKAPTGYQINSTVYEFKKTSQIYDGSVVYRADVEDVPYIKLQLMKSSANPEITADNSCYSLAGAEYTIYTDLACTKQFGTPIVTDEDGYACYGESGATNTDIKDKDTVAYKKKSGRKVAISSGTFYCKETKAPKGFKLDNTVYKFVDSGSVSSYGVKIYRAVSVDDSVSPPTDDPINDPVGIILQKRNAVTGETTNQGLEGAVFQIQYYSTVIDKSYDVASGETAPTLDTSTLKRTWYIKTNERGFTRLDEDYLVNNESYISDDFYIFNGLVSIPIGTIVIKEVEAPQGYAISDLTFYRPISEEKALIAEDTNTPLEIPIDEQPLNAYIGIHKMNNSRKGVAGATYGLYEDETATTLLSTLITDSNGEGLFNYSAGVNKTFYIKEIKAPIGYPLDTTVYPVTPTEENTTVETAIIQDIYEESVKGSILIKKSSNDGIVSNLWFAVTDNLGNEYNAVVTNSNGEVTITGLPVYDENGSKITYTVRELGFKTTPGEKSYGGFTWTVKAENCIKYKGAYYEGVANNTFSDCEYAYSRYYYSDSSTAIKNATGYKKTLESNGTITYSFVNTIPTTDVEVYKNSYDSAKSGFYFKVKDQFGRSYGDIVTNDDGFASYSNTYHKELLSCIKVPNSGICLKLSYQVEELGFKNPGNATYYFPNNYSELYVSELVAPNVNEDTITFNAYNPADTGEISIQKSSDDGDISGICFKLSAFQDDTEYSGEIYEVPMAWDSSGNPIYSMVLKTDENGYASTNGVELFDMNGEVLDGVLVYVVGETDWEITYKLEELGYDNGDGTYSFPKRYVSNEPVLFNLLDNRSYSYTCYNKTIEPGKLQVQKSSEDNIVEGVWFNITATNYDYSINLVTGSDGTTPIIELPIYIPATQGRNELIKYKVTELGVENDDGTYSIPNRYNTPRTYTVTLDSVDNVKIVTVTNTLKKGEVQLYKQDSNGKGLQGSEWELYTSDGELVKLVQTGNGSYFPSTTGSVTTLTTGTGNKLYIYNLPQGDYYFVETKAPKGYMPYAAKVEFSITPAETTVLKSEVTVIDNYQFLSETGGIGRKSYYLISCSLFVAAITILTIHFKKRKMKGEKIYEKNI